MEIVAFPLNPVNRLALLVLKFQHQLSFPGLGSAQKVSLPVLAWGRGLTGVGFFQNGVQNKNHISGVPYSDSA
jgi:hypothetical protein